MIFKVNDLNRCVSLFSHLRNLSRNELRLTDSRGRRAKHRALDISLQTTHSPVRIFLIIAS